MFTFARIAKAHNQLSDLGAWEAMAVIDGVMRTWDDLPEDSDPWEHYFQVDDGDAARIDFQSSWNAVRSLPGMDIMQNALRLSIEKPQKPPRDRGALYARFISLAGWLQTLMGYDRIFLPSRKVGELLSCDPTTVSSMKKFGVEDGLLEVVSEHVYSSRGKSKATEFRFSTELFPGLGRRG
jgi:hypothetical protein